ncbi:MAG: hypothetical protein ABWW69_01730 [Pyrodictiaceae archaeon]
MGYLLAERDPSIPVASSLGSLAVIAIEAVARRKQLKRELSWDELYYTLGEISLAFRVSPTTICFKTIISLLPFYVPLSFLPKNITMLYP